MLTYLIMSVTTHTLMHADSDKRIGNKKQMNTFIYKIQW